MPRKLLYTLPDSARLAFPLIKAGVRRGMSTSAIERSIRNAGIPITRATTLNPLVAALEREELLGAAVRTTRKSTIINTKRLPESVTDISKRFSYQYKISGRDRFGQIVDRHITVSTDSDTQSRQDLDDLAEQLANNAKKYEQLEEQVIELEFGMKRDPDFEI